MLYLHHFTFNPFAENTYIIYNDQNEAIVVDPGMMQSHEQSAFQEFVGEKNLKITKIVNTHAHIDHILGVQFVKDQYQVPLFLHQKDLPVLQSALSSAQMFGLPLEVVPEVEEFIEDGQEIFLGKDKLEVLFTPGHSPGSISLYAAAERWIVAGDVLFEGSIGRTDLPGGDYNTLQQSIQQQLYTLPDDITVYAGHGNPTTIGQEKKSNAFVRAIGS